MAGKVFITGDCHQEFQKFNTVNFPEQKNLDKDDYMIICGDFAGIWAVGSENKQEKYWLKWLDEKKYTTLFIDGNHENFDRLNSYPMKEWHGGFVHVIRPSIFHLMRGQIYEIAGRTFFTFGGASSHDIKDGILDAKAPDFIAKKKSLNGEYKFYRIKHESWWEEELASDEEMLLGIQKLKEYNNSVDYIITHCCSTDTQNHLPIKRVKEYTPDKETDYLDRIKKCTEYKKWFFGHYHEDIEMNDKEIMVYERIIQLI